MVDRAFYAGLKTPKESPAPIGARVQNESSTFVTDMSTRTIPTRILGQPEPIRQPDSMGPRGDPMPPNLLPGGQDGHFSYIEENLDNYLDGALLGYAIDHAMELGLNRGQVRQYTHQMVEFLLERQSHRESDPYFLWLTEVAGCLRVRVETLYDSLDHKIHKELKSHIKEVAKDVAEQRRRNYDSQTIKNMLKSYDISGHIRLLPKIRSAKLKVMSDLRQKRGCKGVATFDSLITMRDDDNNLMAETIRMNLAELTAYQIMTWNQIDAKRDYKVADYRRVLDLHHECWQRTIVSLRMTPGSGVTNTRYKMKNTANDFKSDVSELDGRLNPAPYSWNSTKRKKREYDPDPLRG